MNDQVWITNHIVKKICSNWEKQSGIICVKNLVPWLISFSSASGSVYTKLDSCFWEYIEDMILRAHLHLRHLYLKLIIINNNKTVRLTCNASPGKTILMHGESETTLSDARWWWRGREVGAGVGRHGNSVLRMTWNCLVCILSGLFLGICGGTWFGANV